MKSDWIFIQDEVPEIRKDVEIFKADKGNLIARRVSFNVPTRNPYTQSDEFWYWDVDSDEFPILLLNEICHWRDL